MIQQIGNALLALAHYTEGGVGDTGLTVTVDVWEITIAGVATEVVTGGSATEVGDGLYRYILASGTVDAEALYVFVFKTADADTDQKELAMAWSAGAGWVERVDATLSDIEADTNELQTDDVPGLIAALNDPSAAEVWSYSGDRTLTQGAASVTAAVTGDDITIYRAAYNSISLTGLTTGVDVVEAWFSVKEDPDNSDDDAWIRVSSLAGLERINMAAPDDAADATLTVNGVAGTATIVLKAAAMAEVSRRGGLAYDLKYLDSSGDVHAWSEGGVCTIEAVVTHAVS